MGELYQKRRIKEYSTMKKSAILAVILAATLSLSACGGSDTGSNAGNGDESAETNAVTMSQHGLSVIRESLPQGTISAGYKFTAAVKQDGTVVATGDNTYGQCDVSKWTDIIAVSAGDYNTVGLRSDGTIVVSGYMGKGAANVWDWSDIVAVAMGQHTVGLKSDGTVIAVGGDHIYTECDVEEFADIAAIAAATVMTVGLKSDGTVIAAGHHDYMFMLDTDWTNIVAVSAGIKDILGLKSDGTVVAWRDGSTYSDWTDIVAVAVGEDHAVGLRSDGTVVAVGENDYGQCDVQSWTDIKTTSTPVMISPINAAEAPANDEPIVTTTEAPTPGIEYYDPTPENFDYYYDAALKGVVVEKYTGSASAIRIPTELDGDPIVKISLNSKTITHAVLPDGITEIYDNLFQGCESIVEFVIPDGIATIGEGAFQSCYSLSNIIIPNSVTSIGNNAFGGCRSLTNITIPDSVEVIGAFAFSQSGLTEITLPDNGMLIYVGAFKNCRSLTRAILPDSIRFFYYDIGGWGAIKNEEENCMAVFENCFSLQEVTIPSTVTSIGRMAFGECNDLKNVTIPDSVTVINDFAFYHCSDLRSLTLPDGLEFNLSSRGNIFSGCTALTVTYKGQEYNYTNFDDLYKLFW